MNIRLALHILLLVQMVLPSSAFSISPDYRTYSVELLFAKDSAAINFEEGQLDDFACRAKKLSAIDAVIVVGHAEKEETNSQRLSKQRAKNVQDLLIRFGLSARANYFEGKGATQQYPKGDPGQNRRVEVEVVGLLGRSDSVTECESGWGKLFDDFSSSEAIEVAKKLIRDGSIASHVPAAVAIAKKQMDILNPLLSGPNKIRLDANDRAALIRAAAASGDSIFLERLVSFGIKANEFSKKQLPIIWASCNADPKKVSETQQVRVVQSLLIWGAKADGISQHLNRESSALQCAARNNRMALAELLLRSGSNPNAPKSDPPILAGVRNTEMIRKLVNSGADARARNKDGATLFHMLRLSSPDEVKWLVDLGLGINDQLDIKNGEYLSDLGFRLSPPTEGGFTPLHTALSYASRDVLDEFFNQGAIVNQRDASLINTAWANMAGLAWLVDNGVHLDKSTYIVFHAVSSGGAAVPLVDALHRRGVSLREPDAQGFPPVLHAIKAFSPEMLQRLIELGALERPGELASARDFAEKLELHVRPLSWSDGYKNEELRLNTEDLLIDRQRTKDRIIEILRAAEREQ